MVARTSDGRPVQILTILDEYPRECLDIVVERHISSQDVINELSDLFLLRDIAQYIRSDNGSDFTAKAVREWLNRLGIKTPFIEPGSQWENGYIESFNGKLRDQLLNGEIFTTLFGLGTGFKSELSGVDNVYLNGVLMGLSKNKFRGRKYYCC